MFTIYFIIRENCNRLPWYIGSIATFKTFLWMSAALCVCTCVFVRLWRLWEHYSVNIIWTFYSFINIRVCKRGTQNRNSPSSQYFHSVKVYEKGPGDLFCKIILVCLLLKFGFTMDLQLALVYVYVFDLYWLVID